MQRLGGMGDVGGGGKGEGGSSGEAALDPGCDGPSALKPYKPKP